MPTPVRTQYLEMKARHPGALLLFRMGDFYETFDEDARIAARDLEIVLTQRDMGGGEVVALAGIPYHALDAYLGRLIRKGHRVAICEQVSEPDGKKLVERDVVRVVTPGTVLEPGLVEEAANTYLAAVALDGERAGVAHADVSTGEFAVTEVALEDLPRELARLDPREVLAAVSWVGEVPLHTEAVTLTPLPDAAFSPREARRRLLAHFGVSSLDAYGCEGLPLATAAAAVIIDYLGETHRAALALLTGLRNYATSAYMALDPQTRRNLELFEAGRWGVRTGTLLSVLDRTRTPMGARALRRWLGQPLLDLDALHQRQEAVAWLHASSLRREGLRDTLAEVTDMERAVGRAGAGAAAPRELAALRRSLQRVPAIREAVSEAGDALVWLAGDLDPCAATLALLTDALEEDPQGDVGGGKVVRAGFNAELDELRDAARDARSYIAGLERRERERTGIGSLKVGYNRVFGYYLEVTNAHRDAVPEDYIRRQTLANAERYYTPELKEHESRVLNAGERMEELEQALYRQLCRQVADDAARIRRTAGAVAALDVFGALADAASRYGYIRPTLDEGDALVIRNGRHPVVERMLPEGAFVPNDTALRAAPQGRGANIDEPDAGQVIILTGPNMAGKSTYMRQVALIVLLAQVGSFVPADEAHVGLADRIFTRVGLQDDLAAGQSTFMVEMVETASILHHATRRSLVVLDEIGRGTSTYDGLSIAQAVAEHLHNDPRLGSRTLFATHYHELTALAGRLPRVRNHSVAVAEEDGGVVFLHRIVAGGADRSYGVHVAQLAGLPRPVVTRAWELLAHHEQGNGTGKKRRLPGEHAAQLGLPGLIPGGQPQPSPVEEALRALDVNGLTPLEALNRLYELQQQARGEPEGRGG
ncbi:MAG: DNA mismatch repair protein MutS [Chloroflexota bacterium]